MITITEADVMSDDIRDLVAVHVRFCDGTAPAESCHRLGVEGLAQPDMTVWAAQRDGVVVGIGALKTLKEGMGEIKSMHTRMSARGQGVAQALLRWIIKEARARGMTALWLETGVHPDFMPARALYERFGFSCSGPFADYTPDPHSVFYTLPLSDERSLL